MTPTLTPSAVPTAVQVEPEQPVMTPVTGDKITGNSYTIKSGDDLWNIAVRAYGDGYKWVEIAQANKLEDPNLIHSDNKLVLPR